MTGILALALAAAIPAAVAAASPDSPGSLSASFTGDWGDGATAVTGSLYVGGIQYVGGEFLIPAGPGDVPVEVGPLSDPGCWVLASWTEQRIHSPSDLADDEFISHDAETSASVPVGGDGGDVRLDFTYVQDPDCAVG